MVTERSGSVMIRSLPRYQSAEMEGLFRALRFVNPSGRLYVHFPFPKRPVVATHDCHDSKRARLPCDCSTATAFASKETNSSAPSQSPS